MGWPRTLAALCLAALAAGCACFDSDNRRLLNALDAHAVPESATARWALVPVALPAGVVALALDVAVVHPVAVVDDAWGDTTELLWSPRDESPLRRAVFVPIAALATPFVFVGSWLGRSVFLVPPREEDDP